MIFDKKEFPNLHLLNSLNNTKGSSYEKRCLNIPALTYKHFTTSCQSLNGGMQHHLDIHGRFSCRFGAACLISSGIINPLHIATSDLSVMAIYD
jgi:hypothetical protein